MKTENDSYRFGKTGDNWGPEVGYDYQRRVQDMCHINFEDIFKVNKEEDRKKYGTMWRSEIPWFLIYIEQTSTDKSMVKSFSINPFLF